MVDFGSHLNTSNNWNKCALYNAKTELLISDCCDFPPVPVAHSRGKNSNKISFLGNNLEAL